MVVRADWKLWRCPLWVSWTCSPLYFSNMSGRRFWLGLAGMMSFLLLAASCGGGSDGSEAPEAAPVVTAVPETTAAATTVATTSPASEPETTAAAPEATAAAGTTAPPETTTQAEPLGPPAPDFTLELAAGGTFTLSEESKPVLMIFWAEW